MTAIENKYEYGMYKYVFIYIHINYSTVFPHSAFDAQLLNRFSVFIVAKLQYKTDF